MSRLQSRADAREARVTEAALEAMEELGGLPEPMLVVEDRALAEEIGADAWSRWSAGADAGSATPPAGPYASVVMRLPKSAGAYAFALHQAARVLPPDAPVYVYGANDEGIRSADHALESLYSSVETAWYGRKCRMLVARGRHTEPKGLSAWRTEGTLEIAGVVRPWVSYPGLFAKGGIDPGTLELLATLPTDGPILDFGCGTGVVSASLLARGATAVDALDADALAVLATRENAPAARVHLGDGWAAVPEGRWKHIVSNPPIHRGKDEDYALLQDLIAKAPRRGQVLWLVVQRQVPVQRWLSEAWRDVKVVRESGVFRVWRSVG